MNESKPHSTWDEREYLERLFNEAACDRLTRANRDYQQSHAEYIIPLAKLLNITRSEKQRLVEQYGTAQKDRARLIGALEDIASGNARRVITSSLAWDGTTPPEQIVARSALRDVEDSIPAMRRDS